MEHTGSGLLRFVPRRCHALRACLPTGAVLLCAAAPASAQTTLEARHGDGIWSLLERAGLAPTRAAIADFKRLNGGRLIRGERLMVGRSYALPGGRDGLGAADSPVELVPLFGPRHERVQHKTDRLAGHVYYVVSGHGGPDPGTVGRYAGRPLPEDEIAYDVALRLARRLLEEGATVHVIVRDPDDGIRDDTRFDPDRDERYLGDRPISRSHVRRLRDQAAIINRLYDQHRASAKRQRLLALHVDARAWRHEPQIDVHFQVVSENGRRFGHVLLATFRDQYDRVQPGRGYDGTVEVRDLYLLRETKPVAALVELGNIRHPRDQVRLTRAGNRQALAEWLVRGLLREAEVVQAAAP
ncbi:MAG: N-acetylmuramoyl-L-alanine amidase family protein [Gemmatimonadota bacterium]